MNARNSDHSFVQLVALGFSSGGHEAAGAFFDHLAPHTGLAFVLIDHKYREAEHSYNYLQSHTDMHVVEILDETRPRANTVYVTPSKSDVILVEGVFRTIDRTGQYTRTNIDAFFTSLAKSEGTVEREVLLAVAAIEVQRGQGAGETLASRDLPRAKLVLGSARSDVLRTGSRPST